MPLFTFTKSLAAGETFSPFNQGSIGSGSPWQYRFPPKKSLLEVMANATATGIVMNLTTGAESIVQAESPTQAGGVAGVMPNRLTAEPIVDEVDAGEELVLTFRNTSGGAVTVNGVAILTYRQ